MIGRDDLVNWPERMLNKNCLVIVDLGLQYDIWRSIIRSAVRIHNHTAAIRKILRQTGINRAHHVSNGTGVVEAGNPDQHVSTADAGEYTSHLRTDLNVLHVG